MSMGEELAPEQRSQAAPPPAARRIRLIEVWIWLSALAGLAGWSLSAAGQLNRAGYLVFFLVAAVVFGVSSRRSHWAWPNWRKLARRFRRPFPGTFVLLVLLVFAGGAFYPPTNYTGLNYHLARVLQWLAHGHWLWIHTANARMDFSGCAFEWLTAPLVLFTESDRAIFIVNFVAFLFLPGLIFSVFTRLGVRPRVAWHWMWLLPTGYNFLLQAGSIDNDAFGAIYALAAIDFGCRAWNSRHVRDLWLSLLAAALMTGTKPTNLPLLLPWVILIVPLACWFLRHWLSALPVAALACICSFFPIALMNVLHTGDWLGRPTLPLNLEIHQPLVGLAGNGLQLFLANFVPPGFVLAGWWNEHALGRLPQSMAAAFRNNFDAGFINIGEIPTEDWSGLGFGLSCLLVVSVLAALWRGGRSKPAPVKSPLPPWLCRTVLVAAWISLLAYSLKSGMATAGRLVSPYYLLLVPLPLILPGQWQVVRTVWWRLLAAGVFGLAFVALTLSPDRPLWPAQAALSKVLQRYPGQRAATRALDVYRLYASRNDALAGVRQLLPPNLKVVGFIGDGDDCDISLWRPFGSRRVDHFLLSDSQDYIWSRVHYIVVGGYHLGQDRMTIDDWLRVNDAELVASTNAVLKISEGPQAWYIVRHKP